MLAAERVILSPHFSATGVQALGAQAEAKAHWPLLQLPLPPHGPATLHAVPSPALVSKQLPLTHLAVLQVEKTMPAHWLSLVQVKLLAPPSPSLTASPVLMSPGLMSVRLVSLGPVESLDEPVSTTAVSFGAAVSPEPLS
jgi:hypothetical protein